LSSQPVDQAAIVKPKDWGLLEMAERTVGFFTIGFRSGSIAKTGTLGLKAAWPALVQLACPRRNCLWAWWRGGLQKPSRCPYVVCVVWVIAEGRWEDTMAGRRGGSAFVTW